MDLVWVSRVGPRWRQINNVVQGWWGLILTVTFQNCSQWRHLEEHVSYLTSKGRWRHQFVHSYVVHGSVQQFIHRNQFHPLSVLSCAFVSLEAWTLLSTPRWVTSGTKIRQTVINRPSECSRKFSTSTSLKDKPPFLLLLLNKESWFFFSPLFWRFSFEVCWRLEVKFVFLVSEVVCRWRLNKALLCRRLFSHFFLKRCKKPKPNRPKDVWNQV